MTCDPFSHPWLSGLFGDEQSAALWSAEVQLGHYRAFEAAWSRALGSVGLVGVREAETAARAIEAAPIDIAALRAGTARDGLAVPDLVRQLRAAAGPEAAAVHAGATSQDVIDTALALSLRAQNDLLLERLGALEAALAALGTRFGAAPLMGRTRMQAALPITVADRIAGWRAPLDGHAARLRGMRAEIARVQIGGAVGTCHALGDKAALVAGHVAATLGLAAPDRNWQTDRSALGAYGAALSLVTGSLGKMGQDIALMAQQGLDEIALADGGGSSAMPHKSNPVLAELLVTLARYNATQLAGLHQALVHEQERSGAAWALEWMILPPMAMATGRALAAARTLCAHIERIGAGPA